MHFKTHLKELQNLQPENISYDADRLHTLSHLIRELNLQPPGNQIIVISAFKLEGTPDSGVKRMCC